MKINTPLKLLIAASIAILSSCASQPPLTTKIPVSTSLRPGASKSDKILAAVNDYRSSHGAAQLQRHPGLDRLAQQHCEYLRKNRGTFQLYGKNVSHYGFDGRAALARERYQMSYVSENVAAASYNGSNPGPLMVKLWSESKGHEQNMRGSWTHTGIGVVVDSDGTVFTTQLFSTVSMSLRSSRERFNRFQ